MTEGPCNKLTLARYYAAEAGYDVDYMRVPVTDEKAPKEHDFTLLIQRLWTPPEGAALVFNCQMGRGRTTTGMIIASLLHIRRNHGSLDLPLAPQGGNPHLARDQEEGQMCKRDP